MKIPRDRVTVNRFEMSYFESGKAGIPACRRFADRMFRVKTSEAGKVFYFFWNALFFLSGGRGLEEQGIFFRYTVLENEKTAYSHRQYL